MAQANIVSGFVKTAEGVPLMGVTVSVKNTNRATLTESSGYFSISASSEETLEFSSVGYTTQSVLVGDSKEISISLLAKESDMDEVVVVGYGTQKRSNVTGAVASIDVEKTLGSRPIADAGRGLQGVIPGLSVRIPSGEVGSDPLMRIRGFVGSIEGSSQPLILVNNVEVPSIQMINPNDIESVSILKDASASSIYGAKAAFGVILITTKRGAKTDGVNLTYSNNLSWQNPAKKLK
ncbi:carboxypeptidase-like regulatory domain-containing protein [Niabella ginsengisoli]|uniref:Carboxypeptidase-like regulatory domain-containing protein n=1 Tax=Niabella ginsengisoli TaxID=522298 RepID=A0ABS9SES8_9BACT|nr:carboxypeptidase-like regulatory domain-containing protein [Niabella ginsengisoli]MCH5596826.1 carboxypeptidase-like regulatory domain-containing protein [Niabella ginsengisoli]